MAISNEGQEVAARVGCSSCGLAPWAFRGQGEEWAVFTLWETPPPKKKIRPVGL